MSEARTPRLAEPEKTTALAEPLSYEQGAPVGCVLRLLWMGPGNLALLFIALGIARVPSWSLTWRDAAFWATVSCLVGARYLDVSRFGGLTVHNAPATMTNVWRHAAGLFTICLGIWTLAQSVGG